MIKTREEAEELINWMRQDHEVASGKLEDFLDLIQYLLGAHEYKKEEKQPDPAPQSEQWPKVGDTYFCLYTDGKILEKKWNNEDLEKEFFNQGNVFRTYAQAEAERDLRAHISKFPMPKIRSQFYCLQALKYEFYIDRNFSNIGVSDFFLYRSGRIIHIYSRESDRKERIRLLKKWAEAFSS